MSSPAPFDPTYTATNFSGFSLSVDLVGSDQTLGANWQTLSMGEVVLNASEVQAGGYERTRFQTLGRLSYGNVRLSRPWTPNQSGWITEWFNLAGQFGPTTVAITINYIDVNGQAQQGVYTFRGALPVSWSPPSFEAVPSGQTPPVAMETLEFSHAGFMAGSDLTPGIDDAEAVQQFRLVIITGGATAIASPMSSLFTWTPAGVAQKVIAGITQVSAAQAASTALGMFPAITFWVPPDTLRMTKSADWSVTQSQTAEGSGPAAWNGTQPLQISFNFILDTTAADSASVATTATQGRLNTSTGPDSTNVLPIVEQLLALCEVDPASTLIGEPDGSVVVLLWGEFVSPMCYVTNVDFTFTRFNASGSPTRAEGVVSLMQYPVTPLSTNPTSGGEEIRRTETVFEGDRLPHLAYRAFRSPSRWRDLALANGITDPMRLSIGESLVVPGVSELPPRGESGVATGPSRKDRLTRYRDRHRDQGIVE